MINFFRKTRKKLADDNKPVKYFRYAIGEIALVVIGILIALSINNWNEERKYHNQEITMLKEIKSSLNENIVQLNLMLEYNNDVIKSYEIINEFYDKKLPYNDSLDIHFAVLDNWESPFFNYSAYMTLKNKGVELLSNDSLKQRIVRVFEYDLELLTNDQDKSEWNYNMAVVLPFFSKNFTDIRLSSPKTSKPNNYGELMDDQEFKNILRHIMLLRNGGIKQTLELKKTIEDLMNDIIIEIQNHYD
ncbi:MAG: hypothetical protein DRI75_13265 [Bacteroidetes bacterium]|nr:MAG: hypothetical protein DRI75_13265 [Bacteroidota bacterium]